MVIYLDLLIIINTLMTGLIIWTVAKFFDLVICWWKVITAVIIADLYTIFIYQINGLERIYLSFFLNFGIAVVIVLISFYPLDINEFLKIITGFYFISFLAVGGGISLTNMKNYSGRKIIPLLFVIVLLFTIGKYGWKHYKKRFKPDDLYIPLIIEIDGENIELTAFIDTGNKIYDPLSGKAVIVINLFELEENMLKSKKLKKIISNNDKFMTGEEAIFKIADRLSEIGWENRIKIIPYNVVGHKQDIMVGLKVDKISLKDESNYLLTLQGKSSIIGLYFSEKKLSKSYQALIGSDILQKK